MLSASLTARKALCMKFPLSWHAMDSADQRSALSQLMMLMVILDGVSVYSLIVLGLRTLLFISMYFSDATLKVKCSDLAAGVLSSFSARSCIASFWVGL